MADRSAERLRLLLVEDNDGDARLLQEAAAEVGDLRMDVERVATLAGGLDRLDAGPVDAILLDLDLPDSRGLDTVHPVLERAGGAVVVILTGLADEELARAALREGAQDYLVKDDLSAELLARSLRYAIERKRAEGERLEVERRYRSLFEAAPDAFVLVDEEGRIAEANPAAQRLFGYGRDELVGLQVEELVPDPARSHHRRDRAAYQAEPETRSKDRELRARRRDGSVLDVDIGLAPVSENGRLWTIAAIRDISGRKEAERRLEETVRQLREAQRIAGLGHWEWDVESDLIRWTGETAWIFGIAADAPIQTSEEYLELLHPEDRSRLLALLQSLEEGADEAEITYRISDADEEERWVLGRFEVRERSDGELVRVSGVAQDVTEERRSQQALVESNRRFRSAFEAASVGIALVGPDARVLEANEALCDILGYAKEELQGMRIEEITHPDDIAVSRERFGEVIREESSSRSFEKRYIRKDGRTVWARISITTFSTSDGSPQVVTHIEDITQRKEALERQRRSEERFEKVFETSPIGVTVSTLEDGRFVEVNPAFAAITGYEADELLGRSALELDFWPDPAARDELLRRAHGGRGGSPVSTELRSRSGEQVPVEVSGALIEVAGEEYLLALTRDVSERRAFERELERQALHDSLTGLPNRNLFRDRLEHALAVAGRNDRHVAVVFLDLDRFKVVNDTFGHSAGDELLIAVGERLGTVLRQRDTLARLGGDEFAALLESVGDPEELSPVVGRLAATLDEPFVVDGSGVRMTASLGVAVSSERVSTAEDLLRLADVAMYEAKSIQGNHFHVFDPETDSVRTHRLERETQLWRALERNELRLHYQPVFDLRSGEVVGAEALVRWEHPTEGLLPPGEFIPIAEESGMIVHVDSWVKRSATKQAAAWIEASGRHDFEMSVNLSARHFELPDFVERIEDTLSEARLPARNLELELTERVLLRGLPQVGHLRELGVRVAVDDLGTGYSSLEYLTRLEVDTLKVDRILVAGLDADPRNRAVIEAIALVARRLGLTLIAEGIETREQLRMLQELGCRYGQGYLLARPMPADDLEEFLAAGRAPV
ncbi:MAG TPA: PAS domain S-box protein [Gemmatimonadota bacterium]|nr:PAS domain S-box protein [Gemmatimonadota bacterium]